jgi:hypothetical protein
MQFVRTTPCCSKPLLAPPPKQVWPLTAFELAGVALMACRMALMSGSASTAAPSNLGLTYFLLPPSFTHRRLGLLSLLLLVVVLLVLVVLVVVLLLMLSFAYLKNGQERPNGRCAAV